MFRAADRDAFFPVPNARTTVHPSALNELYDILHAAMQNFAQIVYLARAYSTSLPHTGDGSTAYPVFIYERIRAFAPLFYSSPKRRIAYHTIHFIM